MSGGLRSRKYGKPRVFDDVNPLEGVVNIVDVMLVFACGLMLALAVYWNIDLGPVGERIDVTRGREVTEAPEIREDLIKTRAQGKLYQRMGTVIKTLKQGSSSYSHTDDE